MSQRLGGLSPRLRARPERVCRAWLDARVGGGYRMSFTYTELKPHERIRYTDRFDDPGLPGEMQMTVTFRTVSCGTGLEILREWIPRMIPLELCTPGWQKSPGQLAALVEPGIPNGPQEDHTMRRIADSRHLPLRWSQPRALTSEYILTAGMEEAGRLVFRSMWGSLATAECGEGCWTFKRVGFWNTRATVRPCGADADLAVFRHGTWNGGGTLEFAGGGQFTVTTGFWRTDLKIADAAGEQLVLFRYGGMFRRKADLEIPPAAWRRPELPVLVLFGWYLLIMLDDDASGMVAGTAATG